MGSGLMRPGDLREPRHPSRLRGRVYLRDVLGGQDVPADPRDCRAVLSILRAHGRAMSFTLIRSRTAPTMPPLALAASLAHLMENDEGVSLDDWDLFEAEP